jgi:dipeptidyl aminopeptidase/acylaminoacyl peptidase
MLADSGRVNELHVYPEEGHVFRGDAAADALGRAVAFLKKHLK